MKADSIYRQIRAAIEAGDEPWREGAEVAGEHDLAAAFGASRATLRGALKRLAADGYLAVARGKRRTVRKRNNGMLMPPDPQPINKQLGGLIHGLGSTPAVSLKQFCRDAPALLELVNREQQASESHCTPSFGRYLENCGATPRDELLRPPSKVCCYDVAKEHRFDVEDVCHWLNINPNDKVIWLLRLRFANEVPLALQACVVPSSPLDGRPIAIGSADLKPGGLTQVYEDYGITRHFATVKLRASRPTTEDAYSLGVDTDAPLLEERRISYTLCKTRRRIVPYEYLTTLYTDRMQLLFGWAGTHPDSKSGKTVKNAKPRRQRASAGLAKRASRKSR